MTAGKRRDRSGHVREHEGERPVLHELEAGQARSGPVGCETEDAQRLSRRGEAPPRPPPSPSASGKAS